MPAKKFMPHPAPKATLCNVSNHPHANAAVGVLNPELSRDMGWEMAVLSGPVIV